MKTLKIAGIILLIFVAFGARAQWSEIDNFPGGKTDGCVSFEIGGKIYVNAGGASTSFYQLDPTTDKWSEMANVPGKTRTWAAAFVIGDYGYVGCGSGDGAFHKDFYKYDPSKDEWTKVSDFGGSARNGTFSCASGGKGYVFCGHDGTYNLPDVWEYDPAKDEWKQMASYPGGSPIFPTGFTIGDRIFFGTGSNNGLLGEQAFYEFNPSENTWEKKARFIGAHRQATVGFSVDGIGFVGGGQENFNTIFTDFFAYDPEADEWTKAYRLGFPEGSAVAWSTATVVGSKVYFGTGADFNNNSLNFSDKYFKTTLSKAILSADKIAETSIRVFPNPATDVIRISSQNNTELQRVNVLDMYGRTVLSVSESMDVIDVSGLTSGTYIVQLVRKDESIESLTEKVLIQ